MQEKYGYLGPKGTYSEEALELYLKGESKECVGYLSIDRVIQAVADGEVSHGIVPFENSIEGTVNLTIDLLTADENLKILGEVILPIKHRLIVKKDVGKENIQLIVSHPQAIAQCRKYINRNYPLAELKEVNSTAEAALMASQGKGRIAAIGNERAAKNYELGIVDCDIQDCQDNQTRFVIISKEDGLAPQQAKTSLIISITDRPGGLYQVLREFALANINLTRIESRPAKTNLGDYLFFIDFLGAIQNPAVEKCLGAVQDIAASLRILGSYQTWGEMDVTERYIKANPSLDGIREEIDIIDYQIVELLAKRTQLVSIVGSLKNKKESIRDYRREEEILSQLKQNALKKGVDPELIAKLYQMLFEHFVAFQEKLQTGL